MKLKNGSQNPNIRICLPNPVGQKILVEIERTPRLGNSNQDGFPQSVLKILILPFKI